MSNVFLVIQHYFVSQSPFNQKATIYSWLFLYFHDDNGQKWHQSLRFCTLIYVCISLVKVNYKDVRSCRIPVACRSGYPAAIHSVLSLSVLVLQFTTVLQTMRYVYEYVMSIQVCVIQTSIAYLESHNFLWRRRSPLHQKTVFVQLLT